MILSPFEVTSIDSNGLPRTLSHNLAIWSTSPLFAKFVIDDMITLIEQQYFNDDNRIYFSDDEFYYNKIRKPLLRHYGKRIKEKYNEVMSSNDGEMMQESIRRILREERSLKTIVRDLVKNKGFLKASNVIGSLEKVHEILDLKGTQEDMLFIVNTILKHDLNEPMCNFVVSKWFHSIRTLVNIPLPNPNNPNAWINTRTEIDLEIKISDMIYELGNGLVRGHDIKVSAIRC